MPQHLKNFKQPVHGKIISTLKYSSLLPILSTYHRVILSTSMTWIRKRFETGLAIFLCLLALGLSPTIFDCSTSLVVTTQAVVHSTKLLLASLQARSTWSKSFQFVIHFQDGLFSILEKIFVVVKSVISLLRAWSVSSFSWRVLCNEPWRKIYQKRREPWELLVKCIQQPCYTATELFVARDEIA